jgi:serine/threonine protein kinase
MIGKNILNYEIKALIGEGGMGNVYLAEHTQVSRKVAVKVLLPQFLKNEEIKTRFKNEASTLAHLQHPNIVGLFDYLEDESGMYLIMEYVEGVELGDHIAKVTGPMPENVVVPIMTQVLSAFSYAHSKGIVHRDIKPANILITKDGSVKILDFGIARILGEGNSNLTKTGTQMGTVYYMSPEQVQGKKVDIRSDIYSLGVTFYQMLTGVNPYKDLHTEYEVYSRIVKDDLPPASNVYPGVPNYLETIVNRALQKDPSDRFQNCDEFLCAVNQKSSQVIEDKTQVGQGYVPPLQNQTPPNNLQGSNIAAVFSLIFAVLCLLTAFIPAFTQGKLEPFELKMVASASILMGFLSIILGIKALGNVRNKQAKSSSRGMSLTGLILGSISTFLSLIVAVLFVYTTILADPDGDGFIGDADKCPDTAGTVNGCEDSDNDGVADIEDDCMDLPGDSAHRGCPDTDGDGIFDNVDDCDSVKGVFENNGCPKSDIDGDGVPDDLDECDTIVGDPQNYGCPLTGSAVFWFDVNNSDYRSYFDENSSIKVVFDGKTKRITSFSTSEPDCGDDFCATFEDIDPGAHEYQAYDDYGALIMSGTVMIYSKECVSEPVTYVFGD